MQYFDHSTTATTDDKIVALRMECGGAAVDAYWTIVEQIYRDETALVFFENRHITNPLSHRLLTDADTLETWVLAMLEIGLLERDENDPNAITSQRIVENLDAYHEKCERARQNGKLGGRKPTKKPKANQGANQQQTESKPKAKLTKQNKGIGLDKLNQYQDVSVADAENSAPLTSQNCPCCDGTMTAHREGRYITYNCELCGYESVSVVVA